MKIFKFLLLCIMGFFTITIFSSCWSRYDFLFAQESGEREQHRFFESTNPSVGLWKSSNNDYYFNIIFVIDTASQIKEFEFGSGAIKIGEEEIVFYKDKIDINIAVNENEKDNILYSVMEGNQQVSKLNAPITVENKHNTIDNSIIHYYLSFRKSNITNKEVKKIIEEINDYHEKAKLFLKFTVLMDNEIIDYDITEEYKVLVMKTKRDIFSYIQMRLLI